jgi:uncharacterized protein (UPF0262 family)
MADTDRIAAIVLDDEGLPPPSPEAAQERRIAIFDLVEDNHFQTIGRDGRPLPGPHHLTLALRDQRLIFDITAHDGTRLAFGLSLSPLRQVLRDYTDICAAYFDAVRHLPPSRIEAIDMGRRGIHNEGAALLTERLQGKAVLDRATARRLFTLIAALHGEGL